MNPSSTESLAQKLADFGLTVNQAKVYLSIVGSQTTSVDKIARETELYRQDIYKMMHKLQELGLVTKILGKPIKFEALPIQKALENLLAIEKRKMESRITRLSGSLGEITDKLRKHQTRKSLQEKDPLFSLLTTDQEIRNKFNAAFEKARKEFCVVTTPKLAPRIVDIIREKSRMLAKKGVKTRVIIESSTDESTRNLLDSIDRAHDCIDAKQVTDAALTPFRIIDNKEVWIALRKEAKTGTPWFLWTNSANVVRFYRKNFEQLWEDPATRTLQA